MRKITLVAVGLAGTLSSLPAAAAAEQQKPKAAEVKRPSGGAEVKASPNAVKIRPAEHKEPPAMKQAPIKAAP